MSKNALFSGEAVFPSLKVSQKHKDKTNEQQKQN